jgi:hypothetical protein
MVHVVAMLHGRSAVVVPVCDSPVPSACVLAGSLLALDAAAPLLRGAGLPAALASCRNTLGSMLLVSEGFSWPLVLLAMSVLLDGLIR